MEIQVESLRRALSLLEPVVPRKTGVDACKYVLLANGQAAANNLEAAVAISLSGVGQESACLPHKQALEWLKRVPGGLMATLTPEKEGKVHLAADGHQATLKAVKPEDFPPVPAFEVEHETVVDGDSFVAALTVVRGCAATEDTRPVLHTVCLTLGEQPEAVAADGFRLAWEPVRGPIKGEGNILIPTGTVDILERLWKHAEKPPELTGVNSPADMATARRLVRLGWVADKLRLVFGDVTLTSVLVQGTFPKYQQLIPTDFKAHVSFQAGDLLRALKGMAPVAQDSSGIIRLRWPVDGQLRVAARAEDVGEVTAAVPVTPEGEGKIAFNLGYLQHYLQGKEGMVKLSVSTPDQPGLFAYRGRANVVMMPMFVQWADTKVSQAVAEAEKVAQDVAGAAKEPEEAPEPEPVRPKRKRKAKVQA